VLESLSRQHVKGIFPPEWICRRVEEDYGLDMRVEIVAGEKVTGLEFSVQLKATDRLETSGDFVVHRRCKASTAQYFLHRPEPVMYVIYDAQGKVAYWLWVQPYLRQLNKTCPDWYERKMVKIRIPRTQRLTSDSVPVIANYVQAWQSLVTSAADQEYSPSPRANHHPFQLLPVGEEPSARITPEPGISQTEYTLTLLKSLLPSQFEEVAFIYNIPSVYLPTNVSQVEKAIAVIRYALQQGGESTSKLLNAIFTVAPHLREDVDGPSVRTP
jgi:hypothetical protein